ncbi:hypothetical protein VTJ49DRAFT_776 [Mycothermus thermophilus]|uniref:Uncharacterized protein n=1 Tax=Humicola insolens TaxID=85995 RepID=A0ABR3VE26_HUMIN
MSPFRLDQSLAPLALSLFLAAMATTQRCCRRMGRRLVACVGACLGAYLRLAGGPVRFMGVCEVHGGRCLSGLGGDGLAGARESERGVVVDEGEPGVVSSENASGAVSESGSGVVDELSQAVGASGTMDEFQLFADEPDVVDALAVENEWRSQTEPLPRYTRHAADAESAPPAYAPPRPMGPPPTYEMTLLCDVLGRRAQCPAVDEQLRAPASSPVVAETASPSTALSPADGAARPHGNRRKNSTGGNNSGRRIKSSRAPSPAPTPAPGQTYARPNIDVASPRTRSCSSCPEPMAVQQPTTVAYRGRQIRIPPRLTGRTRRGD